MAVRIWPFDPIWLMFNVLNALMAKNYLTKDEVKNIIWESLPPEMSPEEKETFLNNLFLPNAQPNAETSTTSE